METREIPRDEWRSFFDAFSRQYEDSLATLEIRGQEEHTQPGPRRLPFKGVVLTPIVSQSEAIAISLGKVPDAHAKHTVIEPRHVRLVQTSERATVALEIESADKTTTLLRL